MSSICKLKFTKLSMHLREWSYFYNAIFRRTISRDVRHEVAKLSEIAPRFWCICNCLRSAHALLIQPTDMCCVSLETRARCWKECQEVTGHASQAWATLSEIHAPSISYRRYSYLNYQIHLFGIKAPWSRWRLSLPFGLRYLSSWRFFYVWALTLQSTAVHTLCTVFFSDGHMTRWSRWGRDQCVCRFLPTSCYFH